MEREDTREGSETEPNQREDDDLHRAVVVDGGELAGAVKIKRPSAILPDYEPAAFERRTVLASALRAADPLRAAAPSAAMPR